MRIANFSSYNIIKPANDHEVEEMLCRIESAGRTCYRSEDRITADSARAFIQMLVKRGHTSVLDHESVSVRFVCDRGVSHELVRHRLAAYSQESTRYCDYAGSKEIAVVRPPGLDASQTELWHGACVVAIDTYNRLRASGAPPEIARAVLPTCLRTEIVMTADLTEWRHVLRLRTARQAHPQMRTLMRALLRDLRQLLPGVFDDVGQTEDNNE